MKLTAIRLTIRQRLYGSAAAITIMLVALAIVATLQFRQLGTEAARLSTDTNLYMQVSRSLEKAIFVRATPW